MKAIGKSIEHEGVSVSSDTHVQLVNVSKVYPANKSQENGTVALKNVNLCVPRGSICGIIGRSGAGKSSLIRAVNRLEEPTSGKILIDGEDILTLKGAGLIRLRRKIGMIFQHFNLHHTRTVYENVALPLQLAGHDKASIKRRVMEVLNWTNIADKKESYPAQLSGGQKQRVGISRALVMNPDILLCDEATSALDPESTAAVLNLLRDINRRLGLTIMLITHEMGVIREVCDRVSVIEGGEIVEEDEVWRVFGRPLHPVTKTLLHTVKHTIPKEIYSSLTPDPSPGAALLLHFYYDGGRDEAPDLWQLVRHFSSPVRVLHADVDRVQGRAQGSLLLSIDTADATRESLLQRVDGLADRVEVLGYLDAASLAVT